MAHQSCAWRGRCTGRGGEWGGWTTTSSPQEAGGVACVFGQSSAQNRAVSLKEVGTATRLLSQPGSPTDPATRMPVSGLCRNKEESLGAAGAWRMQGGKRRKPGRDVISGKRPRGHLLPEAWGGGASLQCKPRIGDVLTQTGCGPSHPTQVGQA